MTDPVAVVLADGTELPLLHDHPWGWHANAGGLLIHVTAVRTSVPARTPAKARYAPVERAVLA